MNFFDSHSNAEISSLMEQLKICRSEIKNLRNQIHSLKMVTRKELSSIAKKLEVNECSNQLKDSSETKELFKPIGFLKSQYKEKNGIPRQGNINAHSKGSVKLLKNFFNNPEHALQNLENFSHVWIIFVFHDNYSKETPVNVKAKVKPPRLNGEKVGVFSSRSPHRPNPIGLTLASLDRIEDDAIFVSGIDILDGTPILDIKPYIPIYDQPQNYENSSSEIVDTPVFIANWVKDGKKIVVVFSERASKALDKIITTQDSGCFTDIKKKYFEEIIDVLSSDPRSVYRKNKCSDRLYFCTVNNLHLTCWFDDEENTCDVLKIKEIH